MRERVEYVIRCGWPDEGKPKFAFAAETIEEAREVIERRKGIGVRSPHTIIKRTITEEDVTNA